MDARRRNFLVVDLPAMMFVPGPVNSNDVQEEVMVKIHCWDAGSALTVEGDYVVMITRRSGTRAHTDNGRNTPMADGSHTGLLQLGMYVDKLTISVFVEFEQAGISMYSKCLCESDEEITSTLLYAEWLILL